MVGDYFGEDGYMLSNTITPDGYLVDENGMRESSPEYTKGYENVINDILQYVYNGEVIETRVRYIITIIGKVSIQQ